MDEERRNDVGMLAVAVRRLTDICVEVVQLVHGDALLREMELPSAGPNGLEVVAPVIQEDIVR